MRVAIGSSSVNACRPVGFLLLLLFFYSGLNDVISDVSAASQVAV